ncbi:hypothetical protein HDU93_008455 [Gonapodya sp. JEL0774]|nr:hypothetical protein HDU93_008455 [Gonapodya sp. JEL0774]
MAIASPSPGLVNSEALVTPVTVEAQKPPSPSVATTSMTHSFLPESKDEPPDKGDARVIAAVSHGDLEASAQVLVVGGPVKTMVELHAEGVGDVQSSEPADLEVQGVEVSSHHSHEDSTVLVPVGTNLSDISAVTASVVTDSLGALITTTSSKQQSPENPESPAEVPQVSLAVIEMVPSQTETEHNEDRPRIISEEPETMEPESAYEPIRTPVDAEKTGSSSLVLKPKPPPVAATTEVFTVAAVAKPSVAQMNLDSRLQRLAGRTGLVGLKSREVSPSADRHFANGTVATRFQPISDERPQPTRDRAAASDASSGAEEFQEVNSGFPSSRDQAGARAQQRQTLQRLGLLVTDPSHSMHPRNQNRLTKELERVEHEWGSVRRWDDPMMRSLERISAQVSGSPRVSESPTPLPDIMVGRTASNESGGSGTARSSSGHGKPLMRTFSTPGSGVPITVTQTSPTVAGSLGSGGNAVWRWFTGKPEPNRVSSGEHSILESKRSSGLWGVVGL